MPVTLAARLRRSHFLFLGYEMVDWNLRLVMHRVWGDRPVAYRSWAVDREPTALERAFWRRFDVDVLDVEPDAYVALLARGASRTRRVNARDRPYRGLGAVRRLRARRALFFGRERDTEIVVANLIASRLTVLYGPSGVGKSSLLLAGVARCAARAAGGAARRRVLELGDDPERALAEALAGRRRRRAGRAASTSPSAPRPIATST